VYLTYSRTTGASVYVAKITYSVGPSWSLGGETTVTASSRIGPKIMVTPDDYLVITYVATGATPNLYVNKSTNVRDITAWGGETTIATVATPLPATFPILYGILPVTETNWRIYYDSSTNNCIYYKETVNSGGAWGSAVVANSYSTSRYLAPAFEGCSGRWDIIFVEYDDVAVTTNTYYMDYEVIWFLAAAIYSI
jgi:hypothetical protein